METFTTWLGSLFSISLNRSGGGGDDATSSASFSSLSSSTTVHIIRLESSPSASDILRPPSSQWLSSILLLFPTAYAYTAYLHLSLFFSFFSGFLVVIGSGATTLTLRASAFFTGIIGLSVPPSFAPRLGSQQEQDTDMPYIVPSAASSSSPVSSTPPHSPSHPPIMLTMALANPAPVPLHTPFTSPALPTSPPLASSSAFNSQSFGSATKGTGYLYMSPHAPALVKALSDSNTPTTSHQSSPSSSSACSTPSRSSPPMRRTASASSASPIPSAYRFANTAGSSLPRIPRRRGGSTMSLSEQQSSTPADQNIAQAQSTPPRGRTRSRFVLGGEEETGSGSDGERRREKARGKDRNGKDVNVEVDERAARKRPISAERSTSLKIVPSSSPSQASSSAVGLSELDLDHSESGSECATPTPSSMEHSRRARECALQLKATAEIEEPKSVGGEPSIPGIAPRARRGRGREGARRLTFEDDLENERDETSTVAFPSSNPPSPPPSIAVAAPTPEVTPFSSPQQDTDSKGLADKSANAGSLRLDFSFGGPASEARGLGIDMESALSGGHVRTLSESASLNSVPLIRKKSGEVVRSSLKSRSSSAGAAHHRPSLSLGDIASLAMPSPSVSAPATPAASGKMVHFDKHLEHVKVFKSTSKPAAVSRNGSPTLEDTTSGGEGDSASEGGSLTGFIPRPRGRRLVPGGSTKEEEEAVRRVLMMRVLNMPLRSAEMDEADVRLEGLHLADDAASVQGIVRVRNIAFEKSVAVRFTFDGWQTTSEVIGRWAESCVPRYPAPLLSTSRPRSISTPIAGTKTDEPPAPTFDRFSFSIRLTDMLLRIDEKTFVLAVRYCAAGREMWDNNGGQNYRAVFERRTQHTLTLAGSAVVPASPDAGKEKSKSGETGRKVGGSGGASSGAAVTDGGNVGSLGPSLHNALDKVVTGTNSKPKDDGTSSPAKKTSDLASRYDLDVSLKNHSAWRPSFNQSQTWAGEGRARDSVYPRAPMPWSKTRYGSREGSRQSSMASTGDFSKSRPFESHSLSFNARGLPRGSPRDLDRDTLDDSDVEWFSRARFAASDSANTPDGEPFPRYHGGGNRFISPPASWVASTPEPHVRNHHRSYFDSWATMTGSSHGFGTGRARLTPPGTPDSLSTYRTLSDSDADALPSTSSSRSVTPSAEYPPASSPGRHYSFPPLMPLGNGSGAGGLGLLTSRPWGRDAGDSEASTPSITSVSSPTMTASPSSPPEFSTLAPMAHIGSTAFPDSAPVDSNSYKAFLSSFCFYRGSDGQLGMPESEMPRTHSVSSIEELLSSPSPSSTEAFPLLKGPAQMPAGVSPRATTPTTPPASPGAVPSPPTSAGILETESAMSTRVRG